MSKTYITITAGVFTLIALLHLARIIYGWEAVIGNVEIPMWASWLAVLVAGALALKGWKGREKILNH